MSDRVVCYEPDKALISDGYKVYKRRKKTSDSVVAMEQQVKRDGTIEPKTPVKIKTNKVYLRRFREKQDHLEATKIILDRSSAAITSCLDSAGCIDLSRDDFKRLEIVGSGSGSLGVNISDLGKVGDSEDDIGAYDAQNNAYAIRLDSNKTIKDEIGNVVHTLSDCSDPVPLAISSYFSSAGRIVMNGHDFKPLEIVGSGSANLGVNGSGLQQVGDFRDDTGARNTQNNGYAIRLESNKAVKDETGTVAHTLTDGSDPVPLAISSCFISAGSLGINSSDLEKVGDSKVETGACNAQNDAYAIRLDSNKALKDEMGTVVFTLAGGSDPVPLAISSCFNSAGCIDLNRDDFKSVEIVGSGSGSLGANSSHLGHVGDSKDDTRVCNAQNDANTIKLDSNKAVKDETGTVDHTLTDGSDPVPLAINSCFKSAGCTDSSRDDFKPLEIVGSCSENLVVNGSDLEPVRDSRDDTGACSADNNGYDIRLDSNKTVKEETGIVFHTLTDGSNPVPLSGANMKGKNVSFYCPGDQGFLLLTKSPASDVDQRTKSPEYVAAENKDNPDSGITQDGQPSAGENINEASPEKPGTSFDKEQTQRTKKRTYRPKIMYEGKRKRSAKASNSKPATSQKKNLFKKPKKEKNNDLEIVAEPETPNKEHLSKKICEEKGKQGIIIGPATPSRMARGISVTRVSTDIVKCLNFDLETQSMEENGSLKPVVDANSYMVGDPKVEYPNADHEKETDATRSLESELRRSERIRRCYAPLDEKELRYSKCLSISRNLEPNFLVRFKRKPMLRKKRTDLTVLRFTTRSDFLKVKPSSCKREGKQPKTLTLFEFTRKKRSKRIHRLNINELAATLFCERLPKRISTSVNQKTSNKRVKLASAVRRGIRVRKDKDIPFLSPDENQLSSCQGIQMMDSFNAENQMAQKDLRFTDKETSDGQNNGAKLSELEMLYDIPVLMSLNISSEGIPMNLEDTHKVSTVDSIIDLFSHDLELIIEKMRVLNISEKLLDFNPLDGYLKPHRKQKGKKSEFIDSKSQVVVLSHVAQMPKSMVLHEKSTKQKMKAAKVDLDQETIKEWHLLMMNHVKVGDDADEARKKKWEGERETFRGRVDLFIKRMHLLQADRKFKPWKGSVVDSVVGVFLTQNVSDNLSSSAYMSLAAKYPLTSTQHLEEDEESIVNHIGGNVRYINDEALEEDKGLAVNEPIVEEHEMSPVDTKDGRFVSLQEPKDSLNTESARLEIQPIDKQSIEEPKPVQRKNKKTGVMEDENVDWKEIREKWFEKGPRDRSCTDSVDWDAVKSADLNEVAKAIIDRGQQVQIAGRIQEFLKREAQEHQAIDLEWLRDAPPDLVKRYLLEVNGLGLKSVECIRLLALKHVAFPVDTNVARIAVRLGWVPLEPLPEGVQIHLLKQFPMMDSIQKYLWPRLCTLGQKSLYELHYQMITFGKVFCTKRSPNCNACPMKAECRYFASAYASKRLALMGSQENTKEKSETSFVPANSAAETNNTFSITQMEEEDNSAQSENQINSREPIVEMPPSPVPELPDILDIEEVPDRTGCRIPDISMDMEAFKRNVQDAMQMIRKVFHNEIENDISKALVPLTPEKACIPLPTPRVKYYSKLRTEHVVYVLPDDHELLKGFEKREPDDPTPYLLVKWQSGETPYSSEPPARKCSSEGSELCNDQTCASCCNIREGYQNIYRGTILIPCRTAMRGRFPLNGTYFQINEVFADDETSFNPITFPREMIDRLQTRALYCGSSVTAIFRGLDTRRIQLCFWTGYVCVRGFDRVKRMPKETSYRLHTPPSKKGKKFHRRDADE